MTASIVQYVERSLSEGMASMTVQLRADSVEVSLSEVPPYNKVVHVPKGSMCKQSARALAILLDCEVVFE